MSRKLRIHVSPVLAITLCLALTWALPATSARAQPSDARTAPFDETTKTRPAPVELPRLGVGGARDWMAGVTAALDRPYDDYLEFKKGISDRYNVDYSLDLTIYPQVGTPHGGQTVWLLVYYPSVTWRPFTDAAVGSGTIDITYGQQQYLNRADTGSQAARMGLISLPNDWIHDNFSWSTLAYTHTLPGDMKWLSITVGQYNLFSFDPNAYAANAQTNFIDYGFAQDATQTFPNAGLGAYAQAKMPDGQFQLSGGFQGATNLSGRAISIQSYEIGKYLFWGNFQWTPKFESLGDGIYSVLLYQQPFIPMVSDRSNGISFSASQAITEKWGAFVRVNNASGTDLQVQTSVDFGGVRNDPFERNPTDQLGLALGWNKTNAKAIETPPGGVRPGEWVSEIYYNYTVFKGLHLTPDVQVFFNPALEPTRGAAAVFTLRSTFFF